MAYAAVLWRASPSCLQCQPVFIFVNTTAACF